MNQPNLKVVTGPAKARYVVEILSAHMRGERLGECPIENCGGSKGTEQVICRECFRRFDGLKTVNWIKGVRGWLNAKHILGDLFEFTQDIAYALLDNEEVHLENEGNDLAALIQSTKENAVHPDSEQKKAFEIDGQSGESVLRALTVVFERALHNIKLKKERAQASNERFAKMITWVEEAVPLGQYINPKELAEKLYDQHKPRIPKPEAIKMLRAACHEVIRRRKPLIAMMQEEKTKEKAGVFAPAVVSVSRRGRRLREGAPGAGPRANSGLGGHKKRQRGGANRRRHWHDE